MQLGVGERGAGLGRRDEPRREVDGRAVEVALAHDHLADREADAQLGQALARARLDQLERERARDAGRVGHEHHRVADALGDVGARGRDHVAGRRLEAGEHRRELRRVELVRQAGVARDVGEPDRELHDVRARRRRAHVAVAAADQLELVPVEHVDHVGDAREQLLRRRRVACARRPRTGPARRAAPRCSSAAARSRPPRPARSPRRRCGRAAGCAPGRRRSARSRTSSNTDDVARAEPALERAARRRSPPRARSRPRTRARCRPARAISASVQRSLVGAQACGSRRSS